MSCNIRSIGSITSVPLIRQCLFPSDDRQGSDNWFQICQVSLSPVGDILAIANDNNLVILASKEKEDQIIFEMRHNYKIPDDNKIAAVLCLPIAEFHRETRPPIRLEWTCVVVALDSGIVRFYTENGDLLFEEQFHNEIISKLKCQSRYGPQPQLPYKFCNEEIFIQYETLICIIPGEGLFQNLRKLRRQLINVCDNENDANIELLPLEVRKWSFQEHFKVNDVSVIGVTFTSMFNHLVTTSRNNDEQMEYRSQLPKSTSLLIAGSHPYIGFHYVLEGVNQPGVSDVARVVAKTLRNVLPSWLSSAAHQSNRNQSILKISSDSMTFQYGIMDSKRTGIEIVLTTCHRMAAVSDTLDRIALIDCQRGVIVSLFKGYRHAQCAFMKVPNETESRHHRSKKKVATFLIIYAPKKGTIEIFTVQQGKKIASFSASKYSRLLYITHGFMGLPKSFFKWGYKCQFTCVLIDSDGQLKEIQIPFFFALEQMHGILARDVHLYKKLIVLIKNNEIDSDDEKECVDISSEIKTMEIKKQTIDMLIKTRTFLAPSIMLKIIDTILGTVDKDDDNVDSFINLCNNLKSILNLYIFVTGDKANEKLEDNLVNSNTEDDQFNEEKPNIIIENELGLNVQDENDIEDANKKYDEPEIVKTENEVMQNQVEASESKPEENIEENFKKCESENPANQSKASSDNEIWNNDEPALSDLNPQDLDQLRQLFILATQNNINTKDSVRVTFSENTQYNLADFLSGFELSECEEISLNKNMDTDKMNRIAEMLFGKYINGELTNYNQLSYAISNSTISISDLFDLFLHLWLNKSLIITETIEETTIKYLSRLIYVLVTIANKNIPSLYQEEDNAISPFWKRIRDELAASSRPFSALIVSLLFKHASENYEVFCDEENIEILSYECIQWNLLIGKLEEISLLDIILSNRLEATAASLPKLPFENPSLSLNYIIEAGPGSVSELIACWLTSYGIDPDRVIQNEILLQNENVTQPDEPQITNEKPFDLAIFYHLNILKNRFPHSLKASTLLANMCWEYALAWHNDVQCLDNLNAALMCLYKITDHSLKCGLFQLVWNTHLKIVVECITKLINKAGKLPKAILCKQNTGFSDTQITIFIAICTNFIDTFLDICGAAYSQDFQPTKFSYEDIWEDNNDKQNIIELALQYKQINPRIVQLHYVLLSVLEMITRFSIKHSKPINSMFEPSVANILFTDFKNKVDVDWEKTDIKIDHNRMDFLQKIIASTLDTITINNNCAIYCTEHMEWIDKCLTLAKIWNLDIDLLKIFQIYQLYIQGFDLIAQDLISAIGSRSSNILGEKLLEVAGKRLRLFLSNAHNLSENIAAFNPVLTNYIDLLDDEWCAGSTLTDIQTLSIQIFSCLERNHSKYELAQLLFEACENLLQINKC